MQQSACENNQQLGTAGMGIDLWEVVRENARKMNNQQRIVVGPATIVVMRPRTKSMDKEKTLAAFTAMNMVNKKSIEEEKQPPTVPLAMQSAAAAFAAAARAGDDISSSSDAEFSDSSDAVSLRFTSDSDDEEYLVPELENNEEECA